MTCQEFEEISGAYVLDAVTPAERRAAEEHLATCTSCARKVSELRHVAALLPLAVPQEKPPESLKSRVMAAIREESERPQQPMRMPKRPQRPGLVMGLLAAAAVLALVLFSGVFAWNISLQRQVTTLQSQITVISSSNTPMIYTINGTQDALGAVGELVYYPQQHVTVLIVRGLPQLQGMHVYQGWLFRVKNGLITSAASIGILNVQGGVATLSFPGNANGYDTAAISLEPGPRATPGVPKGPVVALSALKHLA